MNTHTRFSGMTLGWLATSLVFGLAGGVLAQGLPPVALALRDDGNLYRAEWNGSALANFAWIASLGGGNCRGVAAGDFDNDGRTDFVAGRNPGSGTAYVWFYKNVGTTGVNSFAPARQIAQQTQAGDWAMDATAGDFNNDGNLDFVLNGNSGTMALYLGDGTGTFSQRLICGMDSYGRGMDTADFNHDGNLDLVRASYSSGVVKYMAGNGDGTFATPVTVADVGDDPYGVAAGDFDGDGHPDIMANNGGGGTAYFLKGNGNGTFAAAVNIPSLNYGNHGSYDAYDYDGDGKLDVVTSNYSWRQLLFFRNTTTTGAPTFAAGVVVGDTGSNVLSVSAPAMPPTAGTPQVAVDASAASAVLGSELSFIPTVTVTNGRAAAGYEWDFGDGSAKVSGTDPVAAVAHTFGTEGTYVVRLRITDDQGWAAVGCTQVVISGPAPTMDDTPLAFDETQAVRGAWRCDFDAAALSADAGGIVSWEWDFGDGVEQDFETGDLTAWLASAGTWNIVADTSFGSAKVLRQSNTSADRTWMLYDKVYEADTDVTVDADVKMLSGAEHACLLLNAQDSMNYYVAFYRGGTADDILVYRVVNGGETNILNVGLGKNFANGSPFHLTGRRHGPYLEYYLDGALVGMVNDTTFTSGKAGLCTYRSDVLFDNFTVVATAGGTNPANPTRPGAYTTNFESGVATDWTVYDGTWSVITGSSPAPLAGSYSYRQSNAGKSRTWTLQNRYYNSDYTLETDVRMLAGTGQEVILLFDAQDSQNNYEVIYRGRGINDLQVRRIVNGGATEILNVALGKSLGLNTPYHYTVARRGDWLLFWLDGVLLGRVRDATYTRGCAGLCTYTTDALFDNFAVTAYGTDRFAGHTYGAGSYSLTLKARDVAGQVTTVAIPLSFAPGAAPVAEAGGPYSVTDTAATDGSWLANLTGSATDAETAPAGLRYLWDLGADGFDGTVLNTSKWAAYPVAGPRANGSILVAGTGPWGTNYAFGNQAVGAFSRAAGDVLEAVVATGSGNAMVGFKNSSATYSYTQMPHAVYFNSGTLYVYEGGTSRGVVSSYSPGGTYDVRIQLKPAGGARYAWRAHGAASWTLLYDSAYDSTEALLAGMDVSGGVWSLLPTSPLTWSAWHSTGVTQNDQATLVGNGNWGNTYLFTQNTVARAEGVTAQARVMCSSGTYAMVGFKNSSATYHYSHMTYALYFNSGTLYIYEDGNGRGYVGHYANDVWYEVKVELKAGAGARYYYRPAGHPAWILAYDSGYSSATAFKRGLDVDAGTVQVDDFQELVGPATAAARVYAVGDHTVTLRVTDPAGSEGTDTAVVTVTSGQAPTANAGQAIAQGETQAVNGVWTVTFSGAGSSDTSGIWRYEWDWNYDGNSFRASGDEGVSASHAWGAPGTYTVALRVTDNEGQTALTTVQVTLTTGVPPVAAPGGPYAVDEFTGNADAGSWQVALNGQASSDADSAVVKYQWDLGTDTFTGPALDQNKWVVQPATGSSADGRTVSFGGRGSWGTSYCYTQNSYPRAAGVTAYSLVTTSAASNCMVGFKNTAASGTYNQYPYAMQLAGGNVYIYEDGINQATTTQCTYMPGERCEVKIVLKATNGATYYLRPYGNLAWQLVYDSSYSSATSFRKGMDVYAGNVSCEWPAGDEIWGPQAIWGVSQNDALTLTGYGAWGTCYAFTRAAVARAAGTTFQARIKAVNSGDAMVGFKNSSASYHYNQMPYALYFTGGTLQIYEDASNRGSVAQYAYDTWYDVRIDLKAGAGATYWFKPSSSADWRLLYDSTYGGATTFLRGADVYGGTLQLDDYRELVGGATASYRTYGAGQKNVALTVWDQGLNSQTAFTTVTNTANNSPLANAGPDVLGDESNAVEGWWAFVFEATASSDDHGIYTYEWDWNYDAAQGFRPSGQTGVRVPRYYPTSDLGPRQVALRVTDQALQQHLDILNLNLTRGTAPVAVAGPDITAELGATITFDGGQSTDDFAVATYAWTFGDGTTGTGRTPTHAYATLGNKTVTLRVTDHTGQTSATPGSLTVHVVAGDPPEAHAGGPYTVGVGMPVYLDGSSSRDGTSGTVQGIVSYVWDMNVAVNADSAGAADDDLDATGMRPYYTFATAGTYSGLLTVTDGAGHSATDAFIVQVMATAAPEAICVPYRGSPSQYHPIISGRATTLKGVARGIGTLRYQWQFDDNSVYPATPATVSNAYAVELTKTFTGAEGRPIIARLLVLDADNNSDTDEYRMVIRPDTLSMRADIAVDEALWWLHKDQNKTSGAWSNHAYDGNHYASATGSALQAFEINGHRLNGDPSRDPYVDTLTRGFDYLFSALTVQAIGAQTYGNPDSNGNGIGIGSGGGSPIYQGGMIMDAIASSQLPLAVARTGAANIKGRSFRGILTDLADMYAWGQGDSGGGRGGWRYSWNADADNSACQWAAIGMLAAEDIFAIDIPAFVKSENRIWLRASTDGTHFGYTGGGSYADGTTAWRNTTPSAMVQMAFDDIPTSAPFWRVTEDAIADTWNSYYGNSSFSNYYGSYAAVKAMRLARPRPVVTFAKTGMDWFNDPAHGIKARLVNQQDTTAGRWYWSANFYDASAGLGLDLSTAWAVIMLTPSLFELPPVAVAGPNVTWGLNQPLTLDAAASYHLDPARKIVKYEWWQEATGAQADQNFHYTGRRVERQGVVQYDWDVNGDSQADLTTDTPAIQYTWTRESPDANTPYQVNLRVTDDSSSAPKTDEDAIAVLILSGGKRPTANPGGPYTATVGIPVRLSGRLSSDPDPGDYITLYEWDLNNDGNFTERVGNAATASEFDYTFNTPGTLTIGLRVWDNGVAMPNLQKQSHIAYTTVTVSGNLPPVPDIGGPYSTPEGTAITLDASRSADPNGTALSFAWDLNGANTFTDGNTPTVPFLRNANGAYTVKVRVSDGVFTREATATVTVTDRAPTAAFYTIPAAPLEGQEVRFVSTSSSAPDALTGYLWSFGDAQAGTSTAASPVFTYAANGNYTVSLTVTDSDGSTNTATRVLAIRDTAPTAAFTFSPLNPGINAPVTFTDSSVAGVDAITGRVWTLPGDATSTAATVPFTFAAEGNYPVTLTVTDADGSVSTLTRTVAVTAPTDLVVTNADLAFAPNPLLLGGQARLSATLRNQGAGSVRGPFTVQFRVDGAVVQNVPVQGLAAGASFEVAAFWTATQGTHTLTVVADADHAVNESSETNNTATLALGTVSQPDLEVTALTTEPVQPVQGGRTVLRATVRNQGGGTGQPVTVRFSLADATVGTATRAQGLGGDGATWVFEAAWIATAGDARTLTALVDPDAIIAESAENNNSRAITMSAVTRPDLTVTAVSWVPAVPAMGQQVSFAVTVKNQAAAGATRLDIPVTVQVDGNPVGSTVLTGGLAPDATATVIVPWQATAGTHVITALADPPPSAVSETNEGNNTLTVNMPAVTQTDLSVTVVSVSPADGRLAQGTAAELLARVGNSGAADVGGAFNVKFLVDAVEVATRRVAAGLRAGTDQLLTVPWTATGGAHVIRVVADAAGEISEADENNNQAELNLANIALPELRVESLSWLPQPPLQGELVTFTADVHNGGATTFLPVKIDILTAGAVSSSQTLSGGLAADAHATIHFTWTAQAGTGSQVGLRLDPAATVPESNETNNSWIQNFPTIVPPDLSVISAVLEPASPKQGDLVTFTATVKNLNADGGTRLNIPVRFQLDSTVLATPVLSGGLNAGAQKTVTAVWPARAGTHTLRVKADPDNGILETNEANNTLTLALPAIAFPQLAVTDVTWTPAQPGEGGVIVFAVTITNNGGPTDGGFSVQFRIDGAGIAKLRLPNGLGAGESKTLHFPWVARSGDHTIEVVEDCDNEIPQGVLLGRAARYTLSITGITPKPSLALNVTTDNTGSTPKDVTAHPLSGIEYLTWSASAANGLTLANVALELAPPNGGRILLATGLPGAPSPSPYSWNTLMATNGGKIPDGRYRLVARATDNRGGEAEVATAEFELNNTPQVRLAGGPARFTVLTGEQAQTTLTLTNFRKATGSYTLSATVLDGANQLPASGVTATLSTQGFPGLASWAQSAAFTLDLTARQAGRYTVNVTALESANRDSLLTTTFPVEVTVRNPIEVSVAPTSTPQAPAVVSMGGEQTLTLTLINNQPAPDVLTLGVSGLPAEWVTLPGPVTLEGGGRQTVTVSLQTLDRQGDFPVVFQALSRNRETAYGGGFWLRTVPEPLLSELRPAAGARFGSRDVTIAWKTSVFSTSEVLYRSEALPATRTVEYTQVDGEPGTVHEVMLNNLERNRQYFFIVRSRSPYGVAESAERAFIVDNGIVFTQHLYTASVARDYGGKALIGITNTDAVPHEVFLAVSGVAEELAVGFVGAGHDTRLVLPPAASAQVEIGLFTQDATVEHYSFSLHLETQDAAPVQDNARLDLNVHIPVTDFDMTVVAEDSYTLAKKIRLTNHGDPVTDFQVSPAADLAGKVVFDPAITHGYLQTDDSLDFWVAPVLAEGFTYQAGSLIATGAGAARDLFVEFQAPEGKQYYSVQASEYLPTARTGALPGGLEVKVMEATSSLARVKVHLAGTEDSDYVLYTITSETVDYTPTPAELQQTSPVYVNSDSFFQYSPTGLELSMRSQAIVPAEVITNRGHRGSGYVKKTYEVLSKGAETAKTLNDAYNSIDGWVEKYNQGGEFGQQVDGNTGIPDDLKSGVKLFHDFLNVGGDLVGNVPVVGDLLSPMFKAALETYKNGLDIVSAHNRQLDEVLDMLEGKSTGRDWYCTNRPVVSSSCALPPWVNPQNVTGASVGLHITPDAVGTVQPHDLDVFVNGTQVGHLAHAVHSGLFAFPVNPGILNYSNGLHPAINTLKVVSSNFNPGHYASAYDFYISTTLTDATVGVFSAEGELPQVVWDWMQTHYRRPDFSVYPEDIQYSETAGNGKLTVRLNNEGTLSDVTCVNVQVDGQTLDARWVFLGAHARQSFELNWTATGQHVVKVELWQRRHESRTDNNQASRTVKISARDTTGPSVSGVFPANGATVGTNQPTIGGGFADPAGIDPASPVLTLDGVPVVAPELAASQIWFTPATPLADGLHTVALGVSDTRGNRTVYSWSFTVNTQGPVITNVEAGDVTTGGATITWKTSLPADTVVIYGTAANALVNSRFDRTLAAAHSLRLNGLTPGATYYYDVISTTADGHATRLGTFSFFTGDNHPPAFPADPTPSDQATSVPVDAFFVWSCSDPDPGDTLTYDVYLGLDPNPTNCATSALASAQWQPPVLQYSTRYYWRAVAVDSRGARTVSDIWSFETVAPRDQAPVISAVTVLPAEAKNGDLVQATFTASEPLFDLSVRMGTGNFSLVQGRTGNRGDVAYTFSYTVSPSDPAGLQPVIIRGRDAVNNQVADGSRSVLVSRAAPLADFVATPRFGTVPVSISFTDLSANTPSSWSWNFGDDYTSSVAAPSHVYTVPGVYTVSLTVGNANGSDTMTKTDYLDLLPPEVTVAMPAPRAITATPTLTGTIADNGAPVMDNQGATVRVSIGSTYRDQEAAIADGAWSLTVPQNAALLDGTYLVTVTATDAAGNTSTATDYLLVDTTAPVLTIDVSSLTSTAIAPVVTGTVDDTGADVSVSLLVNGVTYPATISNGLGLGLGRGGTYAWSATINQLSADGAYPLTATATDFANRQSQVLGTLIRNVYGPVVTFSPPSPKSPTATPLLSGTIGNGVVSVKVSIGTVFTNLSATLATGSWSLTVPSTPAPLADGSYLVTVTATNAAEYSTAVSGTLIIDTTAPVVTVNSAVTTAMPTVLTGTVDDRSANVSVAVRVNGTDYAAAIAATPSSGTTYAWSVTVGGVTADGAYPVTVTATDFAARQTQANGSLTLDTTEPVLTLNECLTSQLLPQLSGTVTDLSGVDTLQVELQSNVGEAVTCTVQRNGTAWSAQPETPLTYGNWAILVSATDPVGNPASISGTAYLTPGYIVVPLNSYWHQTTPVGLNDAGTMAGNYVGSEGERGAFLATPDGEVLGLQAAVGRNSATVTASGISTAGTVAGYVLLDALHTTGGRWFDSSNWRSFNMSLYPLPNPGTGGNGNLAFGINGDDAVAGAAVNASFLQQAVLWPAGSSAAIVLSPLATGKASQAQAINDSEVMVGRARDSGGVWRAVKWPTRNSVPQAIVLPASVEEGATAVNAAGTTAGFRIDDTGRLHAWRATAGTGTDLNGLGGQQTMALAIGSDNTVAGWSEDACRQSRAVLWRAGTPADLNSLIALPGCQLLKITGVNAAGQLVGQADFGEDSLQAVWLRPLPASENMLPAIAWVGPAPDSTVAATVPSLLQVAAADLDGTVTKVRFYQLAAGRTDQTLIGEATAPDPATGLYALSWTPPGAGNWLLRAEAEDNHGATNASPAISLTATGTVQTLTLSLNAGWSLISFPFMPTSLGSLADQILLELAGGTYAPPTTSQLVAGRAYWVYLFEPLTATVTGYPPACPGLDLPSGWNLIGPIAPLPATAPVPVSWLPLQADGNIRGLLTWNPATGAYLDENTALAVGTGYWIYLKSATYLDVGPPQ